MLVMFDCIFYNYCGSSMCGTIRVFCVIYVIATNFEVTFASKVCFRDEHDIYLICLQECG